MVKRLMVVDDSRVVHLQLAKMLQDTEYEIVAYCQDGETAVARYEELLPDLVTMDIIMSGMDGIETTAMIMKRHPDARIVILSSLAYDETLDEAKAAGAKGFIYKPFEKQQVLTILKKALSEETEERR